MFKKRISLFACVVAVFLSGAITFVGVTSVLSLKHKEALNQQRLDSAPYHALSGFVQLAGDDINAYNKLAVILSMIDSTYIKDYDENLLWDNVYRSLIISIGDIHSQYLTADEYNSLMDSSDGDFVGIGVQATYDMTTSGIYIFGVIPNSPAESAGVKKGDIIIAVEGIEANRENYYDILDLIKGEAGTKVNFTVLRGTERLDFSVERAAVESENVIYEKIDDNTAYIKILSFAESNVSEQFSEILNRAISEGCTDYVFDVRNNAGGYLNEICEVLDRILPQGPIINVVDANGNTTTQNSDGENYLQGGMVVLCNENTASAAELFTAALRDYKLAEIVGKTTFGKGSMQTTRLLSDGSALKLSTAFYNPPSNVSYDGIGIKPDHDVELAEKWKDAFYQMPHDEDTQLQKALELLNSAN